MLPKSVTELLDGFLIAFEAEHPTVIAFRLARNSVMLAAAAKGSGHGSSDLLQICNNVAVFIEKKAHFLWERMQTVIISTEVPFYHGINADIKNQLKSYLGASVAAAERYFEEMRQEFLLPSGYITQSKTTLNTIEIKLNAEVDLFCAKYALSEQKKQYPPANQTVNIEKFNGILGNVTNSQVTLYDYSTIHQLLIDHNVPKTGRRELEDIMDELKEAPDAKKPSLIARGEQWIAKHKEFLGAGIEVVTKAIGAAMDK